MQLGLRVTPETKRKIDQHAAQSGRSQSQEAELRIELSFEREGLLDQALALAYGEQVAGILVLMAAAMSREGRIGGFQSGESFEAMENWLPDPYAYGQALIAANEVFKAFKPEGNPEILQKSGKKPSPLGDHLTKWRTRILLNAVKDPHWGNQFPEYQKNYDLEDLAERVRNLLGSVAVAHMRIDEGSDQ